MEIVICSDEQQVGQVVADRVLRWVERLTAPVLGLATGSFSPTLHNELARRVRERKIDFSCGIGSTLDEYVGINLENPLSHQQTILRTVVEPLRMDPTRVRIPNGSAPGLTTAALEYDRTTAAAGGVGMQVLGIGSNGHVGFNESTSSFTSRTRVKTLTEQTRTDSTRFFGEDERVPMHCVTRGLGTVVGARYVVMVVTGRYRARAVVAVIEGPVTTVCPASIPQSHPGALVIVGEVTATGLNHADYFRHVADILI